MHPRRLLVATSITAVLLVAGAAGAGRGPELSPFDVTPVSQSRCSLAVRDSRPLVLDDGRTAYVDVKSTAVNRGAILGAVTPTRTFRGATVVDSDTLIGFVLDPSGSASPVLNPLHSRIADEIRVAPSAEGGWHLLFLDEFGQDPFAPLDSAEVWYGHFDGARWQNLTRVALIHDGHLEYEFSPDLGVEGDRLRFAFAFQKPFAVGEDPRGKKGLIMLRRDAGRWTADTLDLPISASYVRMARSPRDAAWKVGLVQTYYEEGRYREASLFVAEYDSTWSAPRLVESDSAAIQAPSLIPLRDGLVASWLRVRGGVAWARVPSSGTGAATTRPTTVFPTSREYAAIPLDTATLLWYARVGEQRRAITVSGWDTVTATLYRSGRTIALGQVALPNDAFLGHAVAPTPTDIVMFTTRGPRPDVPIIQTIVTRLSIACPS